MTLHKAKYMDPSVLRVAAPADTAPTPARETIFVPSRDQDFWRVQDFWPGQELELGSSSVDQQRRTLTVNTRRVKVVSWDPADGELVVEKLS